MISAESLGAVTSLSRTLMMIRETEGSTSALRPIAWAFQAP